MEPAAAVLVVVVEAVVLSEVDAFALSAVVGAAISTVVREPLMVVSSNAAVGADEDDEVVDGDESLRSIGFPNTAAVKQVAANKVDATRMVND